MIYGIGSVPSQKKKFEQITSTGPLLPMVRSIGTDDVGASSGRVDFTSLKPCYGSLTAECTKNKVYELVNHVCVPTSLLHLLCFH